MKRKGSEKGCFVYDFRLDLISSLFGYKEVKEGLTSGKKGKISFLVRSLGPCFKDISFDYRVNLWVTFIRPLFLPLAAMGPILTAIELSAIQVKTRLSLRKFLKLPRNFRTDILDQVFPVNFADWIRSEDWNNCFKWKCRRQRKVVEKDQLIRYSFPCRRFLPKEFAFLLRKFTAWCKECQRPFYPEHLEEHGVQRVRIEDIFEDLRGIEENLTVKMPNGNRKSNRKVVVEVFAKHIGKILADVNHVLSTYAEEFN